MQPTDKRIATVEQWQALKGVIDGNIGKARVLTTDDYNWPTSGTKTAVALWLLPPGLYAWDRDSGNNPQIAGSTSEISISDYGCQAAVVTEAQGSQSTVGIFAFGNSSSNAAMSFSTNKINGRQIGRLAVMTAEDDIVDNLTTSNRYKALSANQGKILKDLIDAIVVPTKTSDLTNDSDFQTGTDVATAVNAVETKLNDNVMTELTMATDATKVEFTETKKNLSTGATSTEVDTIPLASTTQAGILNAAGYQSIIDSQDRLDALAGGAVSIANLSANPSQSDLTTAWQTATGETTVFNRASIFDSTNGKNWTYFDNTSAWEVTGTVNQQITLNNFSLGTAGLIVGDNTAGKVFAEQDGTGSVYGWDALNTRVTNVESATASIPSVVQTTGTSTTAVMSQNATASMVFADPSTKYVVQIGDSATAGSGKIGNIAIGTAASTSNSGQVSGWGGSIALGQAAYCTVNNRVGYVALGAFSRPTMTGEVAIGSSQSSHGYNNSNYRLLTGLYDPQNAHDAANKEYVDNLAIAYAALNGTAAPTTATAGTYVGQLYLDTTNDKMYYLSAIDTTTPEYTWAEIGGGPNVVQTTGTSTTDVMSQDAATKLIYGGLGTNVGEKIRIGSNASTGSDGISIGYTAQGFGERAIGIGRGASATGIGAIALGTASSATQRGQFDIGTANTSYGYNNSNYRLLTGLYDGQSDHDAVTVGQLNTAIAGVSGAEEINATDWSALWQ